MIAARLRTGKMIRLESGASGIQEAYLRRVGSDIVQVNRFATSYLVNNSQITQRPWLSDCSSRPCATPALYIRWSALKRWGAHR